MRGLGWARLVVAIGKRVDLIISCIIALCRWLNTRVKNFINKPRHDYLFISHFHLCSI